MINNVVLVGRLARDPELKYTPNGIAVVNFTLAVNRKHTDQNGEKKADFINCQGWRKTAENVANYLRKGSLAGVEGSLQVRSYENNEGKKVYITEVVCESVQFLESKRSQDSGSSNQSNSGSNNQQSYGSSNHSKFGDDPFASDGKPIDISDDDLPF